MAKPINSEGLDEILELQTYMNPKFPQMVRDALVRHSLHKDACNHEWVRMKTMQRCKKCSKPIPLLLENWNYKGYLPIE